LTPFLHLCAAEKSSDKKYKNNKHQHFSVGKIKIDNNQPVCGMVASCKVMLKFKHLFSCLLAAGKIK